MRIIEEHFRQYAHALRFAIGLHGAKKFHPIVKYKHYQISSGARAGLAKYQPEPEPELAILGCANDDYANYYRGFKSRIKEYQSF